MKLLIDNVVFHIQKRGGISIVWQEIISRLLKNKKIETKFLEYRRNTNVFRTNLGIDNTQIISKNGLFFFLKRYINPTCKCDSKFIFHSSYYRTCNNKNAINITTIHDFTYELFYPFYKRIIHQWQKRRAIKHSDYVVCVSENTKKDCMKFVKNIDESKIRVIYNGVSEKYKPIKDKEAMILPFQLHKYIIFVGDRSHYKNFNLVVDFWKQSDYDFVIVGGPLSISEESLFSHLPANRKYALFTDISSEQLNELYNGAQCLIYPSNYEGFGIPILEAQKAGCPVIAHDASSIPEIMGYKDLLLHDLTVEEINEKMKLIENEENRQRFETEGIAFAKDFTWDKTYAKLIELYKFAYNNAK